MEQKFILERLEWIVDNIDIRKLVFGFPEAESVNRKFVMPWSRLNLILSGQLNITLGAPSGPVYHQLTAGDAYYVLPGGGETYKWNTVCEMFCLIPRFNYIRFSHYHQPIADHLPPVPTSYHTGCPYGTDMVNTINALSATAREDDVAGAGLYLANALLRQGLHECTHQPAEQSKGKRNATYERIRYWLEGCYSDNIDREITARHFGITPAYLSRLFKEMSGISFHQQLTALRIEHAKDLLCRTDLMVKEIAAQCGFQNHVHFTRRFREITGVSPARYGRRHKEL